MYSPSRESFRHLASQGNLVPVYRRLLADFETPLSAYTKIRGQGESFLLESVEGGEHLGRYSFVGCSPRAVIRQRGDEVEVMENGKVTDRYRVVPGAGGAGEGEVRDGLAVVERVMGRFRPVTLPELPRFTGGAVGFIGYEFIHDLEPVVPRPARDELGTPTLYFLIADELLVFDRVAQTLTILVNASLEGAASVDDAYDDAVAEIERIVSLLEQPIQGRAVTFSEEAPEPEFVSNQTPEDFQENVRRSKQYIQAGDIFQVVGSQRFSAPVKAPPLDVYRALRSVNPSPYMFLLELDGLSLVGASPEIHVRCENRLVEIRPIAGTRRRGKTVEEDAALELELLADPKERAEHVMLIDLARNDLGRVCEYGTVQVRDLMVVERYSHVMHISSTVTGELRGGVGCWEALRACLPVGTISGAPKIRAMQIIDELEPVRRGPYGGGLGYAGLNGEMDIALALRTIVVPTSMYDGKVWTYHLQASGGIVADSQAEPEFMETVNKAAALVRAIDVAERAFSEGASGTVGDARVSA